MQHPLDDFGPEKDSPSALPRWATTTFVVLFLMNMLDYVDRWALSGVLTKLQPDLKIGDAQAGVAEHVFPHQLLGHQPLHGIFRGPIPADPSARDGRRDLEHRDDRHGAFARLQITSGSPGASWGSARRPTGSWRRRS